MSHPLASLKSSQISEPGNMQSSSRAAEFSRQCSSLIRLTAGQPDLPPPQTIVESLHQAIESPASFKYPPSGGLPQLRERVARRYGVSPSEAVLTCGAKGGFQAIVETLLDPGAEVILAAPYWSGFPASLESVAANLIAVPTVDGKITPSDLRNTLSDKTRMVILNSPSNPTGAIYSEVEYRELEEVLAPYRKQLVIVSDEIYLELAFSDRNVPSAWQFFQGHELVILSGWSKSYSLTGARLGYVVGPPWLIDNVERYQSIGAYPSSLSQMAALAAWSDEGEFPRRLSQRYEENWLVLRKSIPVLANLGLKLKVEPKAGFFVFFDVSELLSERHIDIEQLELQILERAHVALSSGRSFGDPFALRMSFATSKEVIEEALRRLINFLSERYGDYASHSTS